MQIPDFSKEVGYLVALTSKINAKTATPKIITKHLDCNLDYHYNNGLNLKAQYNELLIYSSGKHH